MRYVWKALVIVLLGTVLYAISSSYVGAEIGSWIGIIWDWTMMSMASFNWIIPFDTLKVVFIAILGTEVVFLLIKVFFGTINAMKE